MNIISQPEAFITEEICDSSLKKQGPTGVLMIKYTPKGKKR